jgi:hypothetical protein
MRSTTHIFTLAIALPLLNAMVGAEEWKPVVCVPGDLPLELTYRVEEAIDDFDSPSINWTAVLGGQNAKCSLTHVPQGGRNRQAALRVDYNFVGKEGLEYLQIRKPFEIAERGLSFGFWLKHDGSNFPIRARIVDSSGETHQVDLACSKTDKWQFVAGGFDGPSTSWGGDGNRRLDYPCRFDGITLDRPQRGFAERGNMWIDGVALLRPRKPDRSLVVEAVGVPFGHVYDVGHSITLRAKGNGKAIRWRVRDYWDTVLVEGTGAGEGSTIQFTVDRPGYFACHIELLRDATPMEVQEFRCAALPKGAESARSDFVGVCSHFGQNNYPLPSMDLMRSYGIDQFRDEISWRSFERRPGEYVMPAHAAAYLERAAELHMRPLIIFDYSNPLYDKDGFPNSPAAITAFGRYAVELARQTRDVVGMFEVWNEWVGGCGMGGRPGDNSPEAYGRLLKPTYSQFKKAFPDLTLVGIGGEYGTDCAENVVRALSTAGGDSMDAWSIHPYRYPRSSEQTDLVEEILEIAGRAGKAGANQPLWITEIGWPTHRGSRGSDERTQARYCVRSLTLLQSTGIVKKVFWYDFKDDGTKRDYNEHNFGLIRHQSYHCAPKPAVVALSVFIRLTGQAEFLDLQHDTGRYAARYRRPDGTDVMVVWAERGVGQISVSGRIDRQVDIMGESSPGSDVKKLTEDPVYLMGKELKVEFQ